MAELHSHILANLVLILALTVVVIFVFQKLQFPTVIGFLVVGIAMGPRGANLMGSEIELLAEIGVVLLMFSIGLEFSFERLLAVKGIVVAGGFLQVLATIVGIGGLAFYFGYPLRVSLFLGLLSSLSSTAIVLKIYSERNALSSFHGRLATGVLLLQDILAVPMMLFIPVLGKQAHFSLGVVGWTLGKSLVAVVLIVAASRFAVPWFLHQIARLRNREIFVLLVLLICLGTAVLAFQAGISLALGSFVAGLIISNSKYSHQVLSEIYPLRDSLGGVFFISIGMLVDLEFLQQHISLIGSALGLVIAVKAGALMTILRFLHGSLRVALLLGLALAQVGEFSFILARMGRFLGLLDPAQEQLFLAASILSMMLTPLLIVWGERVAFVLDQRLGRLHSVMPEPGAEARPTGHVLIVGYGLNGRNLARVLREVAVPYRVVDLDPEVRRYAFADGEAVVFGDATRPIVLQRMGVTSARVMVVAISDAVATSRIVWHARQLNPDLHIIVRTRYVAEIDRLTELGANEVIPEEFETSVEIFARVLHEYHIPRNLIALQVDLVRQERYGMLRGLKLEGKRLDRLTEFLVGSTADTLLVQEGSKAVGHSLYDLHGVFGVSATILAAVREGKAIENPGSDFRLRSGDILVLLGSHQDLDHAVQILTVRETPNAQE